jgi:hypothetical protein
MLFRPDTTDGVGLATSSHPLGPFRKSRYNPVLTESFNTGTPIVSTGHGSIVASRPAGASDPFKHGMTIQEETREEHPVSDHRGTETADAQRVMYETPPGSELFYVHHARNSSNADRALYTTRLTLQVDGEEESLEGGTIRHMAMYLTASDQALPRDTTPISMSVSQDGSVRCSDRNILVELKVLAASGAPFELAEASNRVVLRGVSSDEDLEPLFSTLLEDEQTTLVLFRTRTAVEKGLASSRGSIIYQRRSSSGSWIDVVGRGVSCS